jgi:hypothetical protein
MQHEPETQKHGHISGHTERITSKKVHPRGKGQASDDSSKKEASDSEGSSSSRTSSYPEENKRRKSLPKVKNSKNSERPNHPPSMVK